MNKKTIIQTVIIVGCFLASGLVLYNGLFKNSSPSPASISSKGAGTPASSVDESILPYGNSLDFAGVLKRINQQYGRVTFPTLNGQLEVGKEETNLILPESQIP